VIDEAELDLAVAAAETGQARSQRGADLAAGSGEGQQGAVGAGVVDVAGVGGRLVELGALAGVPYAVKN
jgi:hypothetical protein